MKNYWPYTISWVFVFPLVFISWFVFSYALPVSAEILYDPVSNTYIDTSWNSEIPTTSSEDLGITTVINEPVFGYVTLPDGTISYQEVIQIENTISIPNISNTTIQVWSTQDPQEITVDELEELIQEVANEKMMLDEYILEQEDLVRDNLEKAVTQQYQWLLWADLSCIDVIQDISTVQEDTEVIIQDLKNKVQAKANLIIESLETTLSRVQSNILQWSVLEAEYLWYVDDLETYIESMHITTQATLQAIENDVLRYIGTEVANASQADLQKLSESRRLWNSLKQSYDIYMTETQSIHDLMSDRIDEFNDAGDIFFRSYVEAVSENRYEKYTESFLTSIYLQDFVDAQKIIFDEYVSRSMATLYPVEMIENVEVLYNSFGNMFDGSSCDDILNATSFPSQAEDLHAAIAETDILLRAAFLEMWSPTSWNEVETYIIWYFNSFVRDVIQGNYLDYVADTKAQIELQQQYNISTPILQYNSNLQTVQAIFDDMNFRVSMTQRWWIQQVISFLSSMKSSYIVQGNEVLFDQKIAEAYSKWKVLYNWLPSKYTKTAKQLEAILVGLYTFVR